MAACRSNRYVGTSCCGGIKCRIRCRVTECANAKYVCYYLFLKGTSFENLCSSENLAECWVCFMELYNCDYPKLVCVALLDVGRWPLQRCQAHTLLADVKNAISPLFRSHLVLREEEGHTRIHHSLRFMFHLQRG